MKFKFISWFNKMTCRYKGHNFETYVFQAGYQPNDIEQAGLCLRCGFDTHMDYEAEAKEVAE